MGGRQCLSPPAPCLRVVALVGAAPVGAICLAGQQAPAESNGEWEVVRDGETVMGAEGVAPPEPCRAGR